MEIQETLLDQLMMVLVQREVPNLDIIQGRFKVVLDRYSISPKEKALVVYTEGKNEIILKRFLLAKAVAGCTSRTIQHYQGCLQRVFRTIGKDVDTITSIDIQTFLAHLIQSSSLLNADNHRRALSSFYTWCYREELVKTNPMNKVERIKIPKKQKKAFTEMDVEKIRNACRSAREKAIVEILLSTGCRVAEIVGIKIDDIKTDQISIFGKGAKWRTVYLSARAQLAVQAYINERQDSNPYLFPKRASAYNIGETFGKNMRTKRSDWYKHKQLVDPEEHSDQGTIEDITRRLGKRAGVEDSHPHRFRRTCATFALRRGMPIEHVSKMLGHEQISTTQIYLDLSEQELEIAHKKYVT